MSSTCFNLFLFDLSILFIFLIPVSWQTGSCLLWVWGCVFIYSPALHLQAVSSEITWILWKEAWGCRSSKSMRGSDYTQHLHPERKRSPHSQPEVSDRIFFHCLLSSFVIPSGQSESRDYRTRNQNTRAIFTFNNVSISMEESYKHHLSFTTIGALLGAINNLTG